MGRPTVQDVLLLSDRCAALFETLANEKSLAKTNTLAGVDVSKAYLTRMKSLENVFYLAASAEHGSEHPLAKGQCG